MAALQTNTLVNGVWTTTTLDMNAVLQHHQQRDENQMIATVEEIVQAPVYGLLTRTVIASPMVNWILPARIRHMDKNDVVFIGDDLIQLREFTGGKLQDIATKSDFGSRIRSAIVIGNIPPASAPGFQSGDSDDVDTQMTNEPVVSSNSNPTPSSGFPPQYVVLTLESGDLVFLYARDGGLGNNDIRWVTGRTTVPGQMAAVQPGTHLTVDPSSRYIGLSCFQNLFAIYELRSKSELSHQYAMGEEFNPVKGERHMITAGIIHKMEFLYPSFEEMERIILLLLVIKGGRTKIFVYVWDAEENLSTIRPQNLLGHAMEPAAQLPILLIPLRINSNFLLVSEDQIMVYKNVLEDLPCVHYHHPDKEDTSSHHHGIRAPKFTAWARPRRLKEWAYTNDHIYIAREDGLIKQLEIGPENDIEGITFAGFVECNIGKAFACVDFADQATKKGDHNAINTKMSDILVMGGDMSNGGTYLLIARKDPQKHTSIANWTPTPDFVIVPDTRSRYKANISKRSESNGKAVKVNGTNGTKTHLATHENNFTWPDRIFACTGRGKNGAISEVRYGLEAQIGLETPYEDRLIREIWSLPDEISDGVFFLLSLATHSALLHLASDALAIYEVEDTLTWLDLSSPTLLAEQIGNYIIQVTEVGFTISSFPVLSHDTEIDENYHRKTYPNSPGRIQLAAVRHDDLLYMTSRVDFGTEITMSVLQLDLEDDPCAAELFPSTILDEEPTCLCITKLNGEPRGFYALASRPGNIYTIGMSGKIHQISLYSDPELGIDESMCHSMTVIQDGFRPIMLCGFRDGSFRTYIIVTLDSAPTDRVFDFLAPSNFHGKPLLLIPRNSTQIGTTGVTVTVDRLDPGAAFVRCDPDVHRFTFDKAGGEHELSMSSLSRIWYTNENGPSAGQPFVNSVTRITHPGYEDDGDLLIASHSKILVAALDPKPKAVLRTMVIGATPTALYYAEDLDALVVAVNLPSGISQRGSNQNRKESTHGKTNIVFIDQETGENISKPVDKHRNPKEFISELGKRERIMSLGEWKFEKDGAIFVYILVATSSGNLIVASAETVDKPRRIEYWTRHLFQFSDPVYSFAGTDNGLFICAGNWLQWQTLDLTQKKFRTLADIELPSPGVSIRVEDDLVSIVTTRHSIIVVRFSIEEETLLPYLTDQVARSGLQQQLVPSYPLRLMSDRTNSVTGLWYKENPNFTDAASTVFEAELAASIIKFQTGTRRSRTNKLDARYMEFFEDNENTNLSLSQQGKIFGIGINGSMHSFEVLPQNTWVLLRYIQNMATHSPIVSPFTYDRVKQDELGNYQIEPLPKSKLTTRHVNGDVLARCKLLGKRGFRELLRQPLPEDDDFENPNTRHERFVVLVENCITPAIVKVQGWDPYWEAYKVMCSYLLPAF